MNRPITRQTDAPGARRRLLTAAGILGALLFAAVGLLSMIPGMLPSALGNPGRLSSVLQKTIEARGIDAAVTQYRALRAQGFAGVDERESDTNTLGYALLRTDPRSAIRIFELNVETPPESANVYDSLGEAYLIINNRPLAIDNYQKAVSIDPGKKSAVAALQTLTNYQRPPRRPLVLFHIFMGMLGIAAGALAISLRKGSGAHGIAGAVFTIAMLSMSASAAYMAFMAPHGKIINVLMGLLTFYLVATAWVTARRRTPQSGVIDWAGCLAAIAIAVSLANVGIAAANSPAGSRDGYPAALYLVFAGVALLAAGLDLRLILRGGVSGAQRLTRHLWRMCAGWFIGVGSFFLGQQQVFPAALRNTGVLALPSLIVLASLGYWLVRVNAFRSPGDRPPPSAVPAVVPR